MEPLNRFDAILAAARAGDPEALGELYRTIHPPVFRYLRVREPSEAEDLASDVWLDIASGLAGFEGDERGFRAWVFTIARRRVIDTRRRRGRRTELPLEDRHDAAVDDVEAEALTELATTEALAAIGRLPEEQADVVLLRVLAGLSTEEVAAIVGKRPGNVRVLQHRALRRLAKMLAPRGVTP
jgi:RNA polymerase sigma-70 factor (ECF subfamily)